MPDIYTHTTWRVKAGKEEEFARRWKEWIEWSHQRGLQAHAMLLRDAESPGTLISFGPWMGVDAVRHWRATAGYHEHMARMQELLEGFEPRTLEVVAER